MFSKYLFTLYYAIIDALERWQYILESHYMNFAWIMIVQTESSNGIYDIRLSDIQDIDKTSDYYPIHSWIAYSFLGYSLVELYYHLCGSRAKFIYAEHCQDVVLKVVIIDIYYIELSIKLNIDTDIKWYILNIVYL